MTNDRNLRAAQQIAQRLGFGSHFVGEVAALFDHILETVFHFVSPIRGGFESVIVGAPQIFPQLPPRLRSEQQTDGRANAEADQQESHRSANRIFRTLIFPSAHKNLLILSILVPNIELAIL
jgi:hypothetical protein